MSAPNIHLNNEAVSLPPSLSTPPQHEVIPKTNLTPAEERNFLADMKKYSEETKFQMGVANTEEGKRITVSEFLAMAAYVVFPVGIALDFLSLIFAPAGAALKTLARKMENAIDPNKKTFNETQSFSKDLKEMIFPVANKAGKDTSIYLKKRFEASQKAVDAHKEFTAKRNEYLNRGGTLPLENVTREGESFEQFKDKFETDKQMQAATKRAYEEDEKIQAEYARKRAEEMEKH